MSGEDNMSTKVEDETIEEQRWIESEFMKQQSVNNKSGITGEEEEDDDDDDGDAMTDLFSDPDPFDDFHFQWKRRRNTTLLLDEDQNDEIKLHLRGYKAELGQTLHSTGLTLWRASGLLCEYLLDNEMLIRDRRVLELGAGLGVCGILAHHLDAGEVVLTDGDTDTLANLRQNIEANGCSSSSSEDADAKRISSHQLMWGQASAAHFSERHGGRPFDVIVGSEDADAKRISSHQLVWGQESAAHFSDRHGGGPFDVIVGSDIIYVPEVIEPLCDTVSTLLRPESGTFVLAYARRNVPIDLVLQQFERAGFDYSVPDGAAEGVFVFTWKTKT